MTLDDLKNIDFKNIANLPLPVKTIFLAIVLGVMVLAGYWFLWNPAIGELDQAKSKEQELRKIFLDKKSQAINLDAYKQQMAEIENTFGALLRQLPDKSQMDGLLTDINQAGLQRGLEFELFKPGQETVAAFYAEMPITLKISGSYHDLGGFATDISKLSRIVTLNNVSISFSGTDKSRDGRLIMDAVAKTYRYLDANEAASQKTDKKSNKKDAKKK